MMQKSGAPCARVGFSSAGLNGLYVESRKKEGQGEACKSAPQALQHRSGIGLKFSICGQCYVTSPGTAPKTKSKTNWASHSLPEGADGQ